MISMGGSWEITGRLVEEEKRFIGGGGWRKVNCWIAGAPNLEKKWKEGNAHVMGLLLTNASIRCQKDIHNLESG
jgi:hypothetical protein